MLQLPHIEHYMDSEDASFKAQIYRDDSIWYRFYAIPETPTIRRDGKGDPVFLLTVYKFSDDDRNANASLPKGGGYMVFDVELGMSAPQRERLMARLNERVKEEWRIRQLRLGRTVDPENFTGPQAELAVPEWTGGSTDFYLVDDPNLVKGRLSGEAPSLVGSNAAIFNATLTPAGAVYMKKTLVDPSDEGGTDLANVQVKYNVKFWARLPPARITAWGSAVEIHRALSYVWHDFEGRGCNEDISRTTEHYWQYMLDSKAIGIKIDTGTLDANDDAVKELREFAMNQLSAWIQDVMLDKLEPTDPSFPDMEDIYSSKDDVYRLKTVNQVSRDHFRLDITQTSVIEKELNPQATLQTFFAGRSADDMAGFVREFSLDDPFFKDFFLEIKALADWADETVRFVQVDVDYAGQTETFTFDRDKTDIQTWTRSLVDGDATYRYRTRVSLSGDGTVREVESDWMTETRRDLFVSVADPGRLKVTIPAGSIGWSDAVEQVQVELTYEDATNGVDADQHTVILKPDTPTGGWDKLIFARREQPVRAVEKFFLKNGHVVENEPVDVLGNQHIVNEPHLPALKVNLRVAGDMELAQAAIVDVLYEDEANDYRVTETFTFAQASETFLWRVLLRNPDHDTFRYRLTVIPKDPDAPPFIEPSSTGWSEPTPGGTQVLDWPSPPALHVNVRPTRLRFSEDGLLEAEVTLRTAHAAQGEEAVWNFIFDADNRATQTWSVFLENEDAPRTYEWSVTWFFESEEITESGTGDRPTFRVPVRKPQEG